MKKIIALVMCFSVVLLSACGAHETSKSNSEIADTAETTTETTTAATTSETTTIETTTTFSATKSNFNDNDENNSDYAWTSACHSLKVHVWPACRSARLVGCLLTAS